MDYWKSVGAIVKKDFLTEWRSREIFSSMFVFVMLVTLVFNFAFELRVEDVTKVAPGALWVAFAFAGVLGLNRSFILEKDKGCLEGLLLAPVDRSAIFFGKWLGNVTFMASVELLTLPVFSALFNVNLFRPALFLVLALGTFGFAGVGTLFAAMAINTRAREIMLPVLLFSVSIPIMISAVKATGVILDNSPLSEASHWIRLMVVFDVLFTAISLLTFEYVLEE
ncbi:MAG: heme exporter protein CcmB [Anaerolineae bacterium]|nr:heme exporter protein CcmB [Anaerolineae bacterium]MDW8102690.1 heme exporter protein CcmB [Anaerolineae bacterium]